MGQMTQCSRDLGLNWRTRLSRTERGSQPIDLDAGLIEFLCLPYQAGLILRVMKAVAEVGHPDERPLF